MKEFLMRRNASTFLFVAILLCWPRWLTAQQSAPAGHWEGSFSGPNGRVAVQVDLSVNTQGTLVGILATGEVQGVPLSQVSVEGRVVRFEIPSASARFSGTLTDDNQSIEGEFINQAGAAPSVLTRTGDARVAAPLKSAHVGSELEGNWTGILEVEGRKKQLVLKMINQPDGTSVGTIVSVDDGAIELPVTVVQNGRNLRVEVKLNGGVYVSSLTDANELAGTYTESGIQFPLTFHR
jgi:hypothetical protein